ncbi:MAG: translocation/assembly module TamB domain-containing protein [Gemmatimonadaceae bacterium]
MSDVTHPTPPSGHRGRRIVKALLAFVVIPMFLGIIIVLVVAMTPWGNERARRIIVSQGNQRITGTLAIGQLRGNLLSGASLSNVELLDSLKHPVFAARRVEVRYGLLSALRGEIVIKSLVLDTAVIVLDKRPGERWNFQSLMKPSTTPKDTTKKGVPPSLSDIAIRHGRLLYRRPWLPDSTLPPAKRAEAVAKAIDPNGRKRTFRVPGGYQRVLDYHDIDARLPSVRMAHDGQPTAVDIGALKMLAEPYRPPAINVQSLVGTLYASKDSLWWKGAHMVMPGSRVSGDGKIGFRRSGLTLDLTGAPVALNDLRWLDPTLSATGGGNVRYRMRFTGDTAEFAISDADLKYGDASLIGHATVARVSPKGEKSELLIKGADLTIARLTTAAIHELAPSVKLTRTGTLDGHVVVNGSPSAMMLYADLRFDDASAGRSHVIAKGGIGLTGGMAARDLSVQLLPLQVATLSGAGLKIPLGGVLSGDAVVTGTAREGWTVRGDLTHVERSAHSHVVGNGRYQTVGKRIIADATLQPLSLVTVGRFAPSADLRGTVSGKVHAEGTTHDLRINGVLRSQDGGTVDGRGSVALAGSRSRYDVNVALDALNANAFSRKAPVTRLTGTVSARGVGTRPATMNTAFMANLSRSSYDTFTVERIYTRGAATNELLRIDTLDVAESGARATAKGTIGLTSAQNGRLQFALVVDSLNTLRKYVGTTDSALVEVASGRNGARLAAARADSVRRAQAMRIEQLALGLPLGVSMIGADTLSGLRKDSLAGSLFASGFLDGNVKELGVDATVRGSGLVVRGNSARHLAGTVQSKDVRDRKTPLVFRIDADTVQARGLAFELVHAAGDWTDGRVTSDLRIRQDSSVSYAALGNYTKPTKGEQVIRLDSLRARFDTLVWRLTHPADVRLANGSIAVDSVDLRSSANGRLFANGVVPKAGSVRLDVAAENVRVATVLRAMQRAAIADGVLGANALLTGTRADPAIVGRMTLREASYGATRAPDADVSISYLNRLLALDATARDSTGRRVLAGTASLPYDLSLAEVAGSRKIAGALVADVRLDSLSLAALPIRPHVLDELEGKVVADAHVRGSWASPVYSGNAALRDGMLRMSSASTGMLMDQIVADLRLVGDSLLIDSVMARAKGTMRASGSVDLKDMKHPFVRLTATGDNLRVFDSQRGLVDANVEIAALGPLDELRVTGRGEMLGGYLALKQFRKDLLRVKAPGDLSTFAIFDTSAKPNDKVRIALERARPKRVAVIADLSLIVDRGNYYRNRPDANTEFYTGDGEEVRVHIDQRSSEQWAIGFVRIGDGAAFFRTRAFVPARGSLTFGPHTNAPGLVQQVGERIVWEPGRGLFPLQFLTAGTSTGPSVGLESGALFPMRGRELNGYLTMGRVTTSLLQQSGSSLSGSEAWSGQLSGETGALAHRQQGATALGVVLHDIGTGATKEYGLDAFSVSPADVPTELVFGKTGGVRGALIEGGRYITTDLFVAGQLRFTSGIPGIRMAQKFGTYYRFDIGIEPRFLFRAPEELGITHPTGRTGAFGAFLTRMWDF